MQHISATDGFPFANASNCTGKEYSFTDKSMNGALITIQGRYPATGYAMNEISKELAFVLRGSGKICTASQTISFTEHDTVFIDAGEKFYWEGDCDVYTICSPAFDPAQHKEVGGL